MIHESDTSSIWFDLDRAEERLKWGGGFAPPTSARYDSVGRPALESMHFGRHSIDEQYSRVFRVRRAFRDSGGQAKAMIATALEGIEFGDIWRI